MKRAVVTGGTGVTGNALVRYLLNKNIVVTAIIRENSPRAYILPTDRQLAVIMLDLANQSTTTGFQGKYDAFFHLAGDGSMGAKEDKRLDFYLQHKNALMAINAASICKEINCPVFVAAGSQAEYGRHDEPITEETHCEPETAYGISKLYARQATRLFCKKNGIRHIWARLFSVYGAYDVTNNLIASTIRKLRENVRPQYTKCEQIWDYLYSFDAAKAFFLLAEHGKAGETYNVAYGQTRPLAEYVKVLHKIVNPNIEPIFGGVPYSSGAIMRLEAETSKLVRDTGFIPDYTFEKGIEEIKRCYDADCAETR